MDISYFCITFVSTNKEKDMTTFRTYRYEAYQHGWLVLSTDETGDERFEMAFAHESDAVSFTERQNINEPARYAEAVRREEEARRRQSVPSTPYYSITGYYGD